MSSDLREKIIIGAIGFLLTGVLGTIVSTWIQQRGWVWQNRVARIERDTDNALTAYQNVSDLVNARWYASYRLVSAMEHGSDAVEQQASRDEFVAADETWAVKYTSVARDVAVYVDTPFGVDGQVWFDLVWPLACDAYPLGSKIDARSARLILEAINHCQAVVNDEIHKATNYFAANSPQLDGAARKAFTDQAYKRLDAIYKTNETLRCVIFGRALAIRQDLAVASFWDSFFGLDAPSYATPDSKSCIASS